MFHSNSHLSIKLLLGLKPNTEYEIKLLAQNEYGPSPFTDPIKVKTLELSIPTPKISVNEEAKSITVTLFSNSTGYCVIIEVSTYPIFFSHLIPAELVKFLVIIMIYFLTFSSETFKSWSSSQELLHFLIYFSLFLFTIL